MRIAAEGHLTTEALMWNQNVDEKTISGMSSSDFRLVLCILYLKLKIISPKFGQY